MRKKILSLALALTLCLGLTVPAFAAETKSVTFEKFGMVVTMYGYLRTELYKTEDNIIITVYVVEDGSTMEFKAMDGVRYASDEELLRDTGKFFDYGVMYSGYAGYSAGNTWRPLTGPGTFAMDPYPPNAAIGGFDIYNCTFICESDLARLLDGADGVERIPDQPDTSPASGDFAIQDGVLTKYTGSGGTVTIPNGVTSIGDYAFYGCTGLTRVIVPSSVTEIGQEAFRDCTSLTNVTIPSRITYIGKGAFWGCTSLGRAVIPPKVTSLEENVFYGCTSLKSVSIPLSVIHIESNTFKNCISLTDIYYDGGEEQWKASFQGEGQDCNNATIHYESGGSSQPDTSVQPQQPSGTATASPTNDKLEVNGSAADPTVYKIGGSNYFKIRDVAALLNGTEKQFAVGYDGAKNAVTATTGQGYAKQSGDLAGAAKGGDQAAAASNDAIYVDGEKITAEVYKINGSNYFKLRDLGKALDFYVGWSADRGMYIETGR